MSRVTVLPVALSEMMELPAGVLTLTKRASVLPIVTSPELDCAFNVLVDRSLAALVTPVLPLRLMAVAAL